jgi:hypothetical protein
VPGQIHPLRVNVPTRVKHTTAAARACCLALAYRGRRLAGKWLWHIDAARESAWTRQDVFRALHRRSQGSALPHADTTGLSVSAQSEALPREPKCVVELMRSLVSNALKLQAGMELIRIAVLG